MSSYLLITIKGKLNLKTDRTGSREAFINGSKRQLQLYTKQLINKWYKACHGLFTAKLL